MTPRVTGTRGRRLRRRGLNCIAATARKPGATLLTNGHASYPGLSGDFRHDPRVVGKMAAHIVLPEPSGLRVDEALGVRHVSWPAPQTYRRLSQRIRLSLQSTFSPACLVRNNSRPRRASQTYRDIAECVKPRMPAVQDEALYLDHGISLLRLSIFISPDEIISSVRTPIPSVTSIVPKRTPKA